MNSLSRTYEIDTGNFTYEPINNIINSNYYYPFNNITTEKSFNLGDNYYNTSISSHFNTISNNKFKKDYKSDYYNLYNSNNSFFNDNLGIFKRENINFSNNSNQKIALTYQYKNISPKEISERTNELINLQLKMINFKDLKKTQQPRAKSVGGLKKKNKKNKKNSKIGGFNYQSLKNFKAKQNPFYNTVKDSKNSFKINKNKTFSPSINNYRMINRDKSMEMNRNNIWKNKYLKANEEIKDIKNKIKEIKNKNDILEKRLNYVKEKEENKNELYESNNKIKNYDLKLLEKYKISEKIRQKQIDLIIKMQKEVNNMKEKLLMLNQNK